MSDDIFDYLDRPYRLAIRERDIYRILMDSQGNTDFTEKGAREIQDKLLAKGTKAIIIRHSTRYDVLDISKLL